jgi:hypothetical protein
MGGGGMRRLYVVPDTQIRAGVPTDHIDWIARDIVRRMPDYVVVGGDWWDLDALSSHAAPGDKSREGKRVLADLEAGNDAFKRLAGPILAEIDRRRSKHRKRWSPRLIFMFGNHENRLARALEKDPKWTGLVGDFLMETPGFERHPFNQRLWIEGVVFSHYFQSSHSHHAIGGSIDNRLNRIGASFVQFHEQGFRYGTRIQGSGATWHGLVVGACYAHREEYRGNQGQRHWRGVVVLNEVRDGDYCIMPLTLDYLCRHETGLSLRDYMERKHPTGDWAHL